MNVNKHIRYLIAMLAICACFISDAKKVVDIYELTFDENVSSPAIVKEKIAQRVQDFQNKQAIDLINNTLSKLLKFTKTPGMYKMLLVMHSDNTGTHEYSTRLTSARVNSVFDWFDANGSTQSVVPYAFGDIQPLKDNNSMEKRRLNRRLEIYIVPGEEMLEQAKSGKVTGKTIIKKRK